MKRNRLLQSLAIALLGFATTMPVYAELTQNDAGYYEIASDENYEEFRQMVATGNPYANAVLTNNITVKDAIGKGNEQFHYRGTFDGQNYTITLDSLANNTNNHPWGLFQYTEPGCVIRNLTVTGKAVSQYESLGSIVGQARGTRVENCISFATLTNTGGDNGVSFQHDDTGGIIGTGYGVNFIENCAFVGSIDAIYAYGIIGNVHNNVEIKSCYVDAIFTNPFKGNSRQILDKTDSGQILLNNYYHKRGDIVIDDESGATEVTDNELTNGKLCFNLNVNGRRGLVWYQHSDRPYPFKGTNGQVASKSSTSDAIIVYSSCAKHSYDGGICTNCGNIESGKTVDPLQKSGADNMYGDNTTYVNNLRYTLNPDGTAIVRGTHKENKDIDNVTAVHIPETVCYNKKRYTVTNIGDNAFNKSVMEYCYIPGTVKKLENNAFNRCEKLTYLHIADSPSNSAVRFGTYAAGALFKDCPLKTLYIGCNVRWDTDADDPAPFEGRTDLKSVFFGPLVTRISNVDDGNDPRAGSHEELFKGCSINNLYFMGSELSYKDADLKSYMEEGLNCATDIYVNRTFLVDSGTEAYTTYSESGIFKSCVNVAFGPFVKYIGADLFGANKAFYNHTLKQVDFINANRLEKINTEAFYECPDAVFTGLWGQYPLKNIGDNAFYNCDKLEYINFGTQLESIGAHALEDCEVLKFISIPGTVTTIGKDAFDDCPGLQGVSFESSAKALDYEQVSGRFDGTKNITTLYLGRNITNVPTTFIIGTDSPFDSSDGSLSNLTIGPEVTELKRGLFYGLNAISSVTFENSYKTLRFDDTPAYTFDIDEAGTIIDNNPISSLNIDRYLINGDGTDVKGDDWGMAQKLVRDITFGENITWIYEQQFENFDSLQTLIISPSIGIIKEKAFKGADILQQVTFLGRSTIFEEAFADCSNLRTIIFGDDGYLAADAFKNCNKIEEIIINAPGYAQAGSQYAFSPKAYASTKLRSTYDTSTEKVEFQEAPWNLFQNRPFKPTNDYVANVSEPSGIYEHAMMPRKVEEGQFDLFYIPFQWDSYYFGSDAEIYALQTDKDDPEDERYEEAFEFIDAEKYLCSYNTVLDQVDILSVKRLPAGIYAVRTNYPASEIHATRNHFFDEGIVVNNAEHTIKTSDAPAGSRLILGGNGGYVDPDDERANYVFEDGVIKMVNATHDVKTGDVILNGSFITDLQVYNVMLGSNYTYSSKLAVPFHELLEGYATFYNEQYNVQAPEWCTVYVITGEEDGMVQMVEVEDRVITAGQAVVIKTDYQAAIGADDLMTYVTDGSSATTDLYDQNLLRGVSQNTPVADICGSEGYVYVLSCNQQHQKTGFYKFGDNKTIGAGKAYLLPSDFSSGARACLFAFDEVANHISDVVIPGSTGEVYDLTGKRIDGNQTDANGIFIIDNKKVIK